MHKPTKSKNSSSKSTHLFTNKNNHFSYIQEFRKKMTLIDDMGLIPETQETIKPQANFINRRQRNSNTLKLGEL